MSSRKYQFYRGSLDNLSFDVSPIGKNQPILYTNSSTKVDLFEIESDMIKKKYQKQYYQFHKSFHKRSRSQMEKIDKIIKDTNDLNQILSDPHKWQSKNESKNDIKLQNTDVLGSLDTPLCVSPKPKWRHYRKMDF